MKKKNSRKQRKENDTYSLIYQTAYICFIYLTGFLLTLYVHDAYFDIMEAKSSCFVLIMALLSPFLCVTFVCRYFIRKEKIVSGALDIGVLCFLAVSLISTAFSVSPDFAFTGEIGWHIGSRTILFLSIVYFTLRNGPLHLNNVYYPLICVCIFEFILTVFDAAGVDLFHFRDVISGSSYYSFYGTIGNSNWYVGYLSLLVPLFLCLYIGESDRGKTIFYYTAALSGILASVLIGADGIYLAYGFCLFFLIPYLSDSTERLKRLSYMFLSAAVCFFLIKILPPFSRRLLVMNGFSRSFFNMTVIAAVALCGSMIFCFCIKTEEQKYQLYKRKIMIGFESVLFLAAFFAASLLLGNGQNDFGNGRAEIWKTSFDLFKNVYSIKEKLIGIGPELLENVYYTLSYEHGMIYNSAHSEPIQVLMTMGILGSLFWLFLWFVVFKSYFEKKNSISYVRYGIYMSLFSYFAQSFVNSATTLNAGVFVFILILLSSPDDKR